MQCYQVLILFITAITVWTLCDADLYPFSKTIIVKASGGGDYKKISDAIDKGVPEGNSKWIHIMVQAGTYWENVTIPLNKPFIFLKGESTATTVIAYSAYYNLQNATIQVVADNFVAKRITFKNTYNHRQNNDNNVRAPAVAAFIQGDKNAFYECSFLGLQDTLLDAIGRHFFKNCYIEGFVDFICGNGQSVYENCTIKVTTATYKLGGYITAQKREKPDDTSGFVFKYCTIIGSGPVYLGRAWGGYSRVVFYKSKFSDIIRPEGWDAWGYSSIEEKKHLFYAKANCTGPGAYTGHRVNWEKNLKVTEVEFFVGSAFNNIDGWIENQPKISL